jgi:RecQ family ATP-dependent DNA helicase
MAAAAPDALVATLQDVFGFPAFRGEQRAVVEAALGGRDVAVFWSTGSGKSLCYQVPALVSRRPSVVISPLISLMEDQVHKLNALRPGTAVMLGSAQSSADAESRVRRGDFLVVYLSPEKLASSLQQLPADVGLFAVDECHCCSEWGHDFRPAFRNLGIIRAAFPSVPIMALSATATPRVRADVLSVLGMDPARSLVSLRSFDRINLVVTVRTRSTVDTQRDLGEIAAELSSRAPGPPCAIVYLSTTKEVDDAAAALAALLAPRGIVVRGFHGKMGLGERSETHLQFLAGRVHVVVATVAFGMGIDKADIRDVFHYGPPKTVEEYVQQIGRAGRDGARSRVTMFARDADFAKYSNPFYTQGLSGSALEAQLASTARLRAYAAAPGCRRRGLLLALQEEPTFDMCGACDNCTSGAAEGRAPKRDLSALARLVCTLAQDAGRGRSKPPGKSLLFKNKAGAPAAMWDAVAPQARTEAALTEALPALVEAGLLLRQDVRFTSNDGRVVSYEGYTVAPLGARVARGDPSAPKVMLPVPAGLAALEAKAKAQTEELLRALEAAGADLSAVPAAELVDGDGPTLRAEKHWASSMARMRAAPGGAPRAAAHQALLDTVLAWRTEAAARANIAPAALLPPHLCKAIAYVRPADAEGLRGAGARMAPPLLDELARLIVAKGRELGLQQEQEQGESARAASGAPMLFEPGNCCPPRASEHVAPAKLGTKVASWESSLQRFQAGEAVTAIAANNHGTKTSVLASTVVAHLLTAFEHGRALDMARLARQAEAESCGPPDNAQWARIDAAAAQTALDLAKPQVGPLVALLTGRAPAEPSVKANLTPAEALENGAWYNRIKWFIALRRCGLEPRFATPDKRTAGAACPAEAPPDRHDDDDDDDDDALLCLAAEAAEREAAAHQLASVDEIAEAEAEEGKGASARKRKTEDQQHGPSKRGDTEQRSI